MPIPLLRIPDSPQVLDWTGGGLPDLMAGGEFSENMNSQTGSTDIYLPNGPDLQTDASTDRGPQGMGKAEHCWLNTTVVDFDRDGGFELSVPSQRWQTTPFENTGPRSAALLSKGREVRCRGNAQVFSWRSNVSAGNIEADGIMDLVAPSDADNVIVFWPFQPVARQFDPAVVAFDSRRPLLSDDDQPVIGAHAAQNNNGDNHSLLVDWDNDGDLDLINGSLWHIYFGERRGLERRRPPRPDGQHGESLGPAAGWNHAPVRSGLHRV